MQAGSSVGLTVVNSNYHAELVEIVFVGMCLFGCDCSNSRFYEKRFTESENKENSKKSRSSSFTLEFLMQSYPHKC